MTTFFLLFLAAAALAAVASLRASHRRQRALRLVDQLRRRRIAALQDLDSRQFTDCVVYLLKRDGCSPRRLRKAQGKLLLARTGHGETLVQCRFWTAALLGDNQLQDIEQAMRRRGVRRGMLVTAGEVADTLDGKATRAGVEVLDGQTLLRRLLAGNHGEP